MSNNRPAIPEDIKRAVRQECNFGCAICGMPIFQYDHIIDYSIVKEHTAENIVLLCPNHHNDKSTNKLSRERVAFAKQNPFNKSKNIAEGFKIEPSQAIEIRFGSNLIKSEIYRNNVFCGLWINGYIFLELKSSNNWLTMSFFLTDAQGELILAVVEGELQLSLNIGDYTYIGNRIIVRNHSKEIVFDIRLSDKFLKVKTGLFMHKNGCGFEIKDGAINTIVYGEKKSNWRDTFHRGNNGGWAIYSQKDSIYPKPNGFASTMRLP